GDTGGREDRQPQPVRETLHLVQLGIATDGAGMQGDTLRLDPARGVGEHDNMIAVWAAPGRGRRPGARPSLAGRTIETNVHGLVRPHKKVCVTRKSRCAVNSPRKQKTTTMYRIPVVDCVLRMRAVCQAITPSTSGRTKPSPQRNGNQSS